MQRPVALWCLVVLLVFLAAGGLYGGVAMLLDRSGASLEVVKIRCVLEHNGHRVHD